MKKGADIERDGAKGDGDAGGDGGRGECFQGRRPAWEEASQGPEMTGPRRATRASIPYGTSRELGMYEPG